MVEVAIIIPFHNNWKICAELCAYYLEYFESRKTSFEIIIIDDCSLRANSKKLQEALYENENISYYLLKKNLGQFGAIAYGLSKTNSHLSILTDQDITFINPDDLDILLANANQFDLQYVYTNHNDSSKLRVFFSRIWHMLIALSTGKYEELENPLPFRIINNTLVQTVISKNYIVTELDIALIKFSNRINFHKINITQESKLDKSSQYSIPLLLKIGVYFIISVIVGKPFFSILIFSIIAIIVALITKSITATILVSSVLLFIAGSSFMINKKQSYQEQIKQVEV